jgi:argininosuccinate lyase
VDLAGLGRERLKALSPLVGDDVLETLTLEGSVNARNHIGGTAPAQVRAAIARHRARLASA